MNKPAFPRPYSEILNDDGGKLQQFADEDGMSLLDWFAGQADISWEVVVSGMKANKIEFPAGEKDYSWDQVFSYRSQLKFMEAEAMIKESEKRNK